MLQFFIQVDIRQCDRNNLLKCLISFFKANNKAMFLIIVDQEINSYRKQYFLQNIYHIIYNHFLIKNKNYILDSRMAMSSIELSSFIVHNVKVSTNMLPGRNSKPFELKTLSIAAGVTCTFLRPPPLGLTGTCHFYCRRTPAGRESARLGSGSAPLSQYRTVTRFPRARHERDSEIAFRVIRHHLSSEGLLVT